MSGKALSLVATTLVALVSASAQDDAGPSQQDLALRRDRKLDSKFLELAAWHTSYSQALEEARAEEKLVFSYFSRSHIP